MNGVKGYKRNKATAKAFESLEWIESSIRSIEETDDGGIWLSYSLGGVMFRVRVEPDGKIRPSVIASIDGISEKIHGEKLYPPVTKEEA